MANAKNSELPGCYLLNGEKYGNCADDLDAEVPDEVQEILEEKGLLNVERHGEGGLFEGLDESVAEELREKGFTDVQSINSATIEDLTEVKGIGPTWAGTLKARAGVGTGQATPAPPEGEGEE